MCGETLMRQLAGPMVLSDARLRATGGGVLSSGCCLSSRALLVLGYSRWGNAPYEGDICQSAPQNLRTRGRDDARGRSRWHRWERKIFFFWKMPGVPWWHSELRIWRYHWIWLRLMLWRGWISGLATDTCPGHGHKITSKKKFFKWKTSEIWATSTFPP